MNCADSLDERLLWLQEEQRKISDEIKGLSKEVNEASSIYSQEEADRIIIDELFPKMDEAWERRFELFDEWVEILEAQAEEMPQP